MCKARALPKYGTFSPVRINITKKGEVCTLQERIQRVWLNNAGLCSATFTS